MHAELEAHASERLGLHLSAERLRELQRYVASHARSASPATKGALEDFLNGETYFFRYPFFLSLLEGRLAAASSASFRVLCPACSTGEEVYSLAFTLAEKARRLGRRLEIVGTDVRGRAVRHAREGVYGVWSLRNTPPAERPRYFDVPQEGRFRVKDEYRAPVRFAARNLLDAVDDGPYDAVVLCNATLYMHEGAARQAYANVAAALQPDGLLLVAPTDPPPSAQLFRHCPEYGGWSVYRKAGHDRESAAAHVQQRLSELALPYSTPLPAAGAGAEPATGRGGAAPSASRVAAARKDKARRPRAKAVSASVARPAKKAATPGPAVSLWALQPDAAELWTAWSAGRLATVEPRIRQQVFFEPDNPLWRFLYGAVLWERGWLKRARREVERALSLLAAAPAQTAVSGLCSAAELRRVIEEWSVQHG